MGTSRVVEGGSKLLKAKDGDGSSCPVARNPPAALWEQSTEFPARLMKRI